MAKYIDYNGVKYLWQKMLAKFAPLARALPSGGTTGQLLAKSSNADFAVGWTNAPDDFVTEQGTSGIWTYRKWNSGRSECWGSIDNTVTGWSSWGGLYESNQMFQASYPNSLFISTPELFAAPQGSLGLAGVELYQGASSSQTPQMYLLRGNSISGSYACKVNCYAVGKWK